MSNLESILILANFGYLGDAKAKIAKIICVNEKQMYSEREQSVDLRKKNVLCHEAPCGEWAPWCSLKGRLLGIPAGIPISQESRNSDYGLWLIMVATSF